MRCRDAEQHGVVHGRSFLELTEEQVAQVFEMNTLALYRTARIVLPGMIERDRGVIVNISSAAGLTGAPKLSDYSASKFAAIGFTQSLRAELRTQRSDVRTLIVCLYHVHTGMFERARSKVPLLLPSLDPIRVDRQVVDAIEAGRRRLVLPPIMTAVLAVRMLPPQWSDPIVDLFGVGSLMDDFVGRR